jgi:hypothetical protein
MFGTYLSMKNVQLCNTVKADERYSSLFYDRENYLQPSSVTTFSKFASSQQSNPHEKFRTVSIADRSARYRLQQHTRQTSSAGGYASSNTGRAKGTVRASVCVVSGSAEFYAG